MERIACREATLAEHDSLRPLDIGGLDPEDLVDDPLQRVERGLNRIASQRSIAT